MYSPGVLELVVPRCSAGLVLPDGRWAGSWYRGAALIQFSYLINVF